MSQLELQRTIPAGILRSVVGKLRHVTSVFPAARGLMARLGYGLSAYRAKSTHPIIVSNAMRNDLKWWNAALNPDLFEAMPVEWMASELPQVDRWIYLYVTDSYVQLVDN